MDKPILGKALLFAICIIVLASCASKEVIGPIHLQSRTIPVSKGIEPDLLASLQEKRSTNIHAIMQFSKRLNFEQHKRLNAKGIDLQNYVGGNAYIVAVSPEFNLSDRFTKGIIRWAGQIRTVDKISKELAEKKYHEWAYDKREQSISIMVQKFSDVSDREFETALGSLGLEAQKYGASTYVLKGKHEVIEKISTLEQVKRIQQGPIPFQELNERGRRLTDTDQAQWAILNNPQPTFNGESGAGTRLGICDSGIDQAHNDFDTITAAGAAGASRVYNQRAGSGSHGTHVASIAGGNGFNSENNGWPDFSLRGHAPESGLGDYPSFGSDVDSYHDAIVNDGTDVTNHSYVQSPNVYDAEAADIDSIVRGDATDSNANAIPAAPQVWAAGNNGTSSQYGNEEGYYAVFTSAKNTISVGGLDTLDKRLYKGTSFGPTFDGRIKPDVVAPACMDSINGGGIQAASNNTQGYTGKCGTSMAAPAVTGVIGLMMGAYEDTYGVFPSLRPSTYKAMLVQTAIDQIKTSEFPDREYDNPDTNNPVLYHAGPDFSTGYGLVNALDAVGIVKKQNQWKESAINSTGTSHTWCARIPEGEGEFKVTLAWDDEPGDTTTAETSAKLVNDLDLELIPPSGGSILPWVLDPLPLTANPGDGALDPITQADVKPAYRGANRRDNVEMANQFLPEKGIWKVKVKGFNLPNGNAQPYSLVSSHNFLAFCPIEPVDICDLIPELCPVVNICKRFPWVCDGLREVDIGIRDGIWEVNPGLPQEIDEICKYVIDCPGCGGSSWEYCPGWEMQIGNVPEDVNVTIINDLGKLIFRDNSGRSSRKLEIKQGLPGEKHYILFTNEKDEPYQGQLQLSVDKIIP